MQKSHNKELNKIHDLLRLSSEAMVVGIQDDSLRVMRELDQVYMSTRYPDEYELLHKDLDKDKTFLILTKTKEVFKWLEKKLS